MTIANTNWYRTGTISIAANATTVTGKNTQWLSAGINPGATLRIDGTFHALEILSVDSDTQITLRVPFTGSAVTNVAYSIDRNFQSTMNAKLAADVAAMTGKYEAYIDSDMETLTGKSAYEVAVENGYVGTESQWLDSLTAYGVAKKGGYTGTMAQWLESLNAYGIAKKNGYEGTEAQWLESLKAAGEWSNASSRITTLESKTQTLEGYNVDERLTVVEEKTHVLPGGYRDNPRIWHNAFFRFKNLGTQITDEQYATIRAQKFDDLYPGDYWELTIGGHVMRATIVQIYGDCQHEGKIGGSTWPHVRIVLSTGLKAPFHTSGTPENGYLGSTMHTEVMPELLEQLDEAIGAEHLLNFDRPLANTLDWGANEELTHTTVRSKLEIPSIYNFYQRDNLRNGSTYGEGGLYQWCLYKLPFTGFYDGYGVQIGWTQEGVLSNGLVDNSASLNSDQYYNAYFCLTYGGY